MKLSMRIFATCLLVGLFVVPTADALVVTSDPVSFNAFGYTSPVFFHPKGRILTYANFDVIAHDIVSEDVLPNPNAPHCTGSPCPLFRSDELGTGGIGDVYGSETLPAGSYKFYCTFHSGMKATLIVVGT